MTVQHEMVTVGRFGASYGVKGWIKVQSFTHPFDNLLDYQPWYIKLTTNWQQVEIEEYRIQHDHIVAKIAGCNQPEETGRYRNIEIGIPRNMLPSLTDGDYYWSDLVGLTVYNQDGDKLGIVDYIFATGANDVLVVKGDREHLLPYRMDDVITKIDLNTKSMSVIWDKDF